MQGLLVSHRGPVRVGALAGHDGVVPAAAAAAVLGVWVVRVAAGGRVHPEAATADLRARVGAVAAHVGLRGHPQRRRLRRPALTPSTQTPPSVTALAPRAMRWPPDIPPWLRSLDSTPIR